MRCECRPFGSLADKECVPQPNPDGDDQIRENNLRIKELQGDGENCVPWKKLLRKLRVLVRWGALLILLSCAPVQVAFVRLNNGPKFPGRSCRDWCQAGTVDLTRTHFGRHGM